MLTSLALDKKYVCKYLTTLKQKLVKSRPKIMKGVKNTLKRGHAFFEGDLTLFNNLGGGEDSVQQMLGTGE